MYEFLGIYGAFVFMRKKERERKRYWTMPGTRPNW